MLVDTNELRMTTFDPYYKWLGIHPSEQPADHYRLLGLQKLEANADVIANAADLRRSHIRQFEGGDHGDVASQIQAELRAATECLLNPESKSAYDSRLIANTPRAVAAQPAQSVPSAPAPPAMAAPTEVPTAVAPKPPAATFSPSPEPAAPITVPVVPKKVRSKPRGRSTQTLLIGAIGLVLFGGLCGIAFLLRDGQSDEPKAKSAAKPQTAPKTKGKSSGTPNTKRNGKRNETKPNNQKTQPTVPSRPRKAENPKKNPDKITPPKEAITKQREPDSNSAPPQPVVLSTIPNSSRKIPRITKRAKIVFEKTEGLLGLGQDFTVEAVMSVQTNRGGGQVLGVGSRRSGFQWSLVLGQSRSSHLVLVYGGLDGKSKASKLRPSFANDGKPLHFAIQRVDSSMQIFIDGKKLLEQEVPRRDVNDATELILGSGFPLHNVCDAHAVRVSSKVRYQDDFDPPSSLADDSDTLCYVLFDRESERVPDRSGHQRDAVLHNVEWISFSESGKN